MELDDNGLVNFISNLRNNKTLITPSQIGAHIITVLKKTAEKRLGMPVSKSVISVPAEFNDEQRSYTKLAATLAGK